MKTTTTTTKHLFKIKTLWNIDLHVTSHLTTEMSPILKSCLELQDACYPNGTYTIDPDGLEMGVEPFTVDCNMDNGKIIWKHFLFILLSLSALIIIGQEYGI